MGSNKYHLPTMLFVNLLTESTAVIGCLNGNQVNK